MARANIDSIAGVLLLHGETFHGGQPERVAVDWDDYGFSADEVDEWCCAEVWDPGVALELQLAGMSPTAVKKTSARLIDENGAGSYTSGCPTYAACNGDLATEEIVNAWRASR